MLRQILSHIASLAFIVAALLGELNDDPQWPLFMIISVLISIDRNLEAL